MLPLLMSQLHPDQLRPASEGESFWIAWARMTCADDLSSHSPGQRMSLASPSWSVFTPNLPTERKVGRGGGQVVSVLAFNSDDPDSSPPEINTRLIVRK